MAKTRSDLIKRVLEKLDRLPAGQNPAAEDVVLIGDNLTTALASLAADQVVYVPNVEQIQDEVFQPLAVCVADIMSKDFGSAMSPDDVATAKGMLKRFTVLRPLYSPQVTSYV